MRRFTAVIVLCCLLCSCGERYTKTPSDTTGYYPQTTASQEARRQNGNKMTAVWISCYELPSAQKGEAYFREQIGAMFKNIKELHANTVFVHVRPFADAVYPSKIYPWSRYACGSKNPGFDPLKVMLEEAKSYNLSFHAWINPFRVSLKNDLTALPENSPAQKLISDKSNAVAVIDEGIYFSPASTQVHSLIYDGVREILDNYDVDGIHIDDYFYPCADTQIDAALYGEYTSSGGDMSLDEWRKNSVSAFAAGLYSLVKSYGEDKIFSISPAGNIDGNEKRLFADVALWLSTPGYADIIIPQLYFGFENGTLPFESTAKRWDSAASPDTKLVWGLAAYKCGALDENAGPGSREWIENNDILSRQFAFVQQLNHNDGIALFSYSYIFRQKSNENLKKEMQLLKNMI